MEFVKKDKGITLIALIVTVIVLIILASVTITKGTEILKKAKIESFITNMVTIRAKAKVYAEEINAETWAISNENERAEKIEDLFENKYYMTEITEYNTTDLNSDVTSGSSYKAYLLTETAMENIGLSNEKNDNNYIVVYNSDDYTKLDIVYNAGINFKGNTFYTLSKLQEEMNE